MIKASMLGILIACISLQSILATPCIAGCSGNGICTTNNVCECFPGFHGADCSLRLCPAGRAWVDFPTDTDRAHADYTECSNAGICNRATGRCKCRPGYTGAACDMTKCPLGTSPPALVGFGGTNICSGNGRCMSLRSANNYLEYTNFAEGETYIGWDQDMIHGCVCDPGWEGSDCSRKSCLKGDDPMTSGVDEVQLIDCTCTTCAGGVYLKFNGQTTGLIPYDATDEYIAYRLQQLSTIQSIRVQNMQGKSLCSSSGSTTKITFLLPTGPQNAITATKSGLTATLAVRTGGTASSLLTSLYSVTGTRELKECSNRGTCDYTTGTCTCYTGYANSDGRGGEGTRNDCGYQVSEYTTVTVSGVTTSTNCPVANGEICSGNGVCASATGKCTCSSGYDGPACEFLSCPTSNRWFGNIDSNHTETATCSGIGLCNRDTGVCEDCGGPWGTYSGEGCQYLACPEDSDGNLCSGQGTCMTMNEMAPYKYKKDKTLAGLTYTTPWDADLIKGCVCNRAVSVDNSYFASYLSELYAIEVNETTMTTINYVGNPQWKSMFYRGPYADAATDFKGYDCSQALCPTGDNPTTFADFNEIQKLEFSGDTTYGTFRLTFRGNESNLILCNDSLAMLKYRLEELYTVSVVEVYRSSLYVDQICDTTSDIYVEFLGEFGNLPLLTSSSDTGLVVTISEYQTGTKEDIECSGMGICDEDVGICQCFGNYMSSNGTIYGAGERGDCTYMNKLA